MLIDTIKKDRIQAMKDKQKAKATTLATLLGEVDTEVRRGIVLDDALVISKIQKTIKGLDEILKLEPKAPPVLNEISASDAEQNGTNVCNCRISPVKSSW